ncbi:MAG: hypothetical protein JXQ75_21030 [Phycisphaerae bacterium]|nr:hypothetical protein [Phycisphaerae bacterium]
MKIRKEQMQAFSESREEAFVARMVAHLRDDLHRQLEAQHLEEAEIEPLVRRGKANAEAYGMVYEDGIQLYLECMAILGPDFDRDSEYPWARKILRRRDLDSNQKAEQIEQHLIFGTEEPPVEEATTEERP